MQIVRRTVAAALIAAIIPAACSRVETGSVVLQGQIEGDPGQVVVVSYLPGQEKGYHYPEVSDGQFQFTLDGVPGFADLIVSVGGVEFGARIDAGDTLGMSFTVREYLEDVSATYGDRTHEKENQIWKDFYETYDHPSNYGITDDIIYRTDFEDIMAQIDSCDAAFRTKHAADMTPYHLHRADLAYDLLKAFMLDMIASRDESDAYSMPQYAAMLDRVDPNDPDQTVFPMVNRWAARAKSTMEGTELDRDVRFMQEYRRRISNPDIRQMLAENMIPFIFWQADEDSLELLEPFIAEIARFAPDGAALASDCRERIDKINSSKPGSPVPDTVLRTPDGKEVALSSLFGKVLYVDLWATWCAPCLREGPYFRALAQQYRDDDRICFVSISTDSTDQPWLEFLAAEQPFWPQFRLDGDYDRQFCGKLGIDGIPRFLLIAPDGTFISSNCARPSSDAIAAILDAALDTFHE